MNMTREKIENTLLAMGIPIGVKGFVYISDAIEVFEERGTNINFTKVLYQVIAEKRKTTWARVERAIRYALETARTCRGDYDTVNKYIGFANHANSHSLKQLYAMLKREEPD